MLRKMKWLMFIAALVVIVSGCTAGKEAQDQPNGSEQPVIETGSENTPSSSEDSKVSETPSTLPAPIDEPATEQPAEDPAGGGPSTLPAGGSSTDLNVSPGATIEIETMIEGMSEKVQVTEYTLTPYDIYYQMRISMGEPTVGDGQVVYSSTIGTIAIEVQAGVSLDDAVAAAQTKFKDGYEAKTQMDISTDVNGYPGMLQYFEKDGSSHGYKVYDINGDALVIFFSYQFEAADGMAAIFNEFETSIHRAK